MVLVGNDGIYYIGTIQGSYSLIPYKNTSKMKCYGLSASGTDRGIFDLANASPFQSLNPKP